jgi:chromosome segregation ATPase
MLKFGQIIDLSILSKVGVDEGAAALRKRLKSLERSSVTRLSEWDQRIQAANDELAAITQQNTRWLERVAQLTKAQYDLEDQLNATTRNVHVADTRPTDEKENNERRQLLQLVQIQEKEIDSLKAEIHVLRRKGGHVFHSVG